MKHEEFTRKCPECGKDQYYATLKGKKVADKLNRTCGSCRNKKRTPIAGEAHHCFGKRGILCPNFGRTRSDATKQKMSIAFRGDKNPMFGRKGSLCPSFGRKRSEDHKRKLSIARKGVPRSETARKNSANGQVGKVHSEETKRKMRVSKIKHIIEKNGSIRSTVNKRGCAYFDQLEQQMGWTSGRHGLRSGEFHIKELGYFVDYYEPNLNIVVEYDEPLHYYVDNRLKEKDVKRMLQIKEHLGCRFLRYNERTQQLTEY